MTLIEKLVEDAKAAPSRRVALPECEAVKTLLAARRVLDEGVGTPVLVSPRDVIEATAAENPDGTIALVLLNRTYDEISLSIKLKGTEASSTCPAHAMQTMIFHPMHAIF